MDGRSPEEATRPKRTDVGYKRPPVETQFKKGQKPPPRKKSVPKPLSTREILTKVLREERRVTRNGKAAWVTNAELLMEIAFQLAEKGNASLSRALTGALIAMEKPPPSIDEVVMVSDPDCGGVYTAYERVKL
jgi:hypothetical protein